MGGGFSGLSEKLEEKKPVIYAGDLNVAHEEIDLKNPKTNRGNAGFTDEERSCFPKYWKWIYRHFPLFLSGADRNLFLVVLQIPGEGENAGWRIDYFVVSQCLQDRLTDAKIHTEVPGSDHCPIELDIQ